MTLSRPARLLGLLAATLLATAAAAESRVRIGLTTTQAGATTVTFGLPLAPGALADPNKIQVVTYPGNVPIAGVKTKTLLNHYDAAGAAAGIRSVLIQFPASAMGGTSATVEVVVDGPVGASAGTATFATASFVSPEIIETTTRLIALSGGTYSFTETAVTPRTLFTGREPQILATYPEGYLASTGIIGEQLTRTELAGKPKLTGLQYLSDEFGLFTTSNRYADGYRMHPTSFYDSANFEGWLYDRCATYLSAYAHANDVGQYRHAMRACSYYAGAIGTSGAFFGLFTGKPTEDVKYSHLRGVYTYYALTGDETAFTAASNMAAMWLADTSFVGPYRQGRIGSSADLWTERLLATSLEGLVYGFQLTGNAAYRTAAQQMFETAHKHITTTSQAELNAIMQTIVSFPPQNCWIHSAAQHAEGTDTEPWCSSWMSELIIDPMRAYYDITGDTRVDEIFVRLGRFVRDVGTTYFEGDLIAGTRFTVPGSSCYDAADTTGFRRLTPAYGSGIDAGGVLRNYADFADYEHCVDAAALMASAIRSLIRRGQWNNAYNVGPFTTEGQSFVALYHEFSMCAKANFNDFHRTRRDPRQWTSAQLQPNYGGGNPTTQTTFVNANKIGYPSYPSDPQRKLSWWFNMSMLGLEMLDWTGISFTNLQAGFVQGAGCAQPATPLPPATHTVTANGKANQAIAFGTAPALTGPGTSGYVSAKASSGLVVTYSSTTPAVCTASGARVAVVAAGTCTIAANQAGNLFWNAAPQATQNILVGVNGTGDDDNDGIPNAVEVTEGTNPNVKDNDVFANARLFSMQQYRDFLNREGDAGGITGWTGFINAGNTRTAVIEGFFSSNEFQGTISPVARLYFAYFLRIPDYGGLQFWISQYRAGTSLASVSQAFATSSEFTTRYGALNNTQFVTLVYQNVLARAPDTAGLNFWVGQLNGGMTRGAMMLGFSESAEFVNAIRSEVNVTMTYVGMLRRSPDTGGFAFWVPYLDQGNSLGALINGFLLAPEYRARFLP